MNLDLKLQEHAKNIPDHLALGWESSSYTYKELNEKVQHLADNFYKKGIELGDRIAIILDNCPEFVISYYACMRVGAISVPINPSLTAREFIIIINDSNPTIIITNHAVRDTLTKAHLDGNPSLIDIDMKDFNGLLEAKLAEKSVTFSKDIEECTILYTSGTTGLPKGAILTHDGLYHNAQVFAEAFKLTKEDRTLIVPPLSHIAAQSNCLNTTMYSGGYNYMLPRWESSFKTLTTMEKEAITFFFGPPTMYTYLLHDQHVHDFELKLKYAYTGAAPLPLEIFNKWVDTFGFEIVEGYGLTECSPVVSTNPPHGRKKIGSIGLPIQDVRVKIVDEQFKEVSLHESGELVVQGPNVMKGYFNKLEENNLAFEDGWFKTGDIAKQDIDGYLYIVDRKKDVIIRSGFNVYPREIEEVLYQHPGVLEVAVIGYPDAEKGELVKAVITLKSNFNEENTSDIIAFCRERLANYKVPSTIEVVDALPKNSSGKIVKGKLRELYV